MKNKQDSEIRDIIEGFQIMGSISEGLVNPNELREIMDIMNMSEKNPFIYKIILDLCHDKETQQKGGIVASDFISLLDQNLNDVSSIDELQRFFSIFSNPDTNTIPLTTFSQIIGDKDTSSKEEKVKKLISNPEINGKNLDFNEFQDIMQIKEYKKNMGDNIVYKKKTSSNFKKYPYNDENNKEFEDNINNTGIHFSNNEINIDNNFNDKNLRDSLDSLEKNPERNNYQNNESPKKLEDNNNIEIKYSYKKVKQDKLYINTNIINNQINNNIDINNNDINKFDNININQEKKDEEGSNTKKKYRHKRKSKNADSPKEKQIDNKEEYNSKDSNNDEVNYSYKNNFTRGRIENKDIRENNYNNGNEEKNEIKSEKRYHRRYRDVKSSTSDKKEEKKKGSDNGENNEKISTGYSKYRRKK